MIINKTLKMELLSDLCPTSGDGFAGFVDTDVNFDKSGLPYIPGKRIKGCLRECGLDIISIDGNYIDKFKALFGEIGASVSGALNIGNGMVENYNEIVKGIENAHRSELAELYTSVRTRTKMEKGKAVPGTLRTTRVLNKGDIYEFPVSLTTETNEFFEMCVKLFRSMGLNRSRGLGEINCTLVDAGSNSGVKFVLNNSTEQKTFSYWIELLEPSIVASRSGKPSECEDYIFGSVILGIFATRYIKNNVSQPETAHKDEAFKRIFLEGKVKFTAAMPFKNSMVYYPAPLTLKTNKVINRLSDDSGGIPEEQDLENPICKRVGGFVSINNGMVNRHSINKISSIHHARPADKGKGRASEAGGEMFTYEALEQGQMFAGSVIGASADIEILAELFDSDNVIRIGRSRTAQYGKATINPLATNLFISNNRILKNNDQFRIVAVTPIILEDEKGTNTTNLDVLMRSLGSGFKIVRYACSETVIAGYNAKWMLPRAQERAIAEGSVIVFKYSGDDKILDLDFIGRRTGEGFGQVRVEDVPASDMYNFAEDSEPKSDRNPDNVSVEVSDLRKKKNVISEGIQYGEKQVTKPQNATLQRIITMLEASDSFDAFAKKLGEIKQPEQRVMALAFAANKDKWYFKTNTSHLSIGHISELLTKHGYDFNLYKTFLSTAIQRIKQKRRSKAKSLQKRGDVSGS